MTHRRLLDDAHALVVGISAYLHATPLPAAVRRGAERVAAALADPDLGGYPAEQVRLLTDGGATREAILEELAALAALTGPGSTVVVYFAGHGGRLAGGDACLLPVAADDASSATPAAGVISGAELAAAVAAIPAGRVLVIFDCCHAGGVEAAGGLARGLAGGLPESWCESLGNAGRGRVVLAAARGDERSWLAGDDAPSVFTRHLLAALHGGAAGRGGWVRVWDLFEYLQPRVTGERPDQHPVLKAELEENFPVALALGGLADGREQPDGLDGYHYHAYVSYADRGADADWVWDVLLPRLEEAGLAIAVSGDAEQAGVARVVSAERGIERARRTLVVLSDAYLEDEMTGFVDVLAQTVGLEEGVARLLPVRFDDFDPARLPARLRMLVSLDLAHPRRGPRNLQRLIQALHAPLPRTGGA